MLSQTLYDSGATAAKTRQRNAELLAQRSASLVILRSVLSDLIDKLLGAVGARLSNQALRENEQLSRRSLEVVQARLAAGSANRVDVLSAEASLADATRQLRTSQSEEERYTGQLAKRLAALPDISALANELEETTQSLAAIHLANRSTEAIFVAIQTTSPDVANRLRLADATIYGIAAAKAEGRWSLKWSAQTTPIRQWGGFQSSSGWRNDVALTATIPLFDGGARQARIGQALANADAAAANVESERLAIAQDAWSKWAQWAESQAALSAATAALDAAIALEKARREQYGAGAGTLSDLLTAQTQLATQRKQWVSSRSDLWKARLVLLLAVGALDGCAMPERTLLDHSS